MHLPFPMPLPFSIEQYVWKWVTNPAVLKQICRLLQAACLHKATSSIYSAWLTGCPLQSSPLWILFIFFPLEFITVAQWGPESSANEERWGEMKTLSELSSGTRASKASWQFQRVFIPDSTLAISMEYPALCSRAVLKAGLWDGGKDEVKTPHPLGFGL